MSQQHSVKVQETGWFDAGAALKAIPNLQRIVLGFEAHSMVDLARQIDGWLVNHKAQIVSMQHAALATDNGEQHAFWYTALVEALYDAAA